MLRFAGWARACERHLAERRLGRSATPRAPSTRLGQSPLRSPSVFNFFRPGYVPPNSAIADARRWSRPSSRSPTSRPWSAAVNYLQRAVSGAGVGDVAPTTRRCCALADDAAALVAEINLVLAADQLGAATAATIATAVATIAGGSDPNRAASASTPA